MLNYIWFGMMAISVVAGIFTGRIDAVTEAAINMSKVAVEISIGPNRDHGTVARHHEDCRSIGSDKDYRQGFAAIDHPLIPRCSTRSSCDWIDRAQYGGQYAGIGQCRDTSGP